LEVLAIYLGIFFDHLVYFTAIGNILWPFGIFCGNLVYLSAFWNFGPRKIWQPCFQEYWIIDMQAERSGKSYNNLWRCHA
jgi:hypothetical protein